MYVPYRTISKLESRPMEPPTIGLCLRQQPGLLYREKAPEKRPIAAQREAEILGGDILTALPVGLEFRSFGRERFGQALRCHRDETIGLLDGSPRLVNKTHLDCIPSGAKILRFFG